MVYDAAASACLRGLYEAGFPETVLEAARGALREAQRTRAPRGFWRDPAAWVRGRAGAGAEPRVEVVTPDGVRHAIPAAACRYGPVPCAACGGRKVVTTEEYPRGVLCGRCLGSGRDGWVLVARLPWPA